MDGDTKALERWGGGDMGTGVPVRRCWDGSRGRCSSHVRTSSTGAGLQVPLRGMRCVLGAVESAAVRMEEAHAGRARTRLLSTLPEGRAL
eukprot:310902-Chlamydomonas_euryale.AAC.2